MFFTFQRFARYSREEVAKALAPDYRFEAQRGTWGIWGIVPFGGGPNFVFFVTLGQSQAGHEFDEGISEEGLLRWQSQPGQGLQTSQIQQFIGHDENENDILLFMRTKAREKYAFMGRLKYVQHDSERENPVYFQWKVLDFDPSSPEFLSLGIPVEQSLPESQLWTAAEPKLFEPKLIEVPIPIAPGKSLRTGISTREFKKALIDYEERDRKNRSLGRAGEDLVLKFERDRLLRAGREDLAQRVEHVALTIGDSAGFDIRSFDPESKRELHIEVKTTAGPSSTGFYMSSGEVRYASNCTDLYRLVRVFGFGSSPTPSFFSLRPPLEAVVSLTPTQFRAKLR